MDVTVKVAAADGTTTNVVVPVTVTPPSSPFWVLRHSPDGVNTYWSGIANSAWADGAFVYYPSGWGHSELMWDSYWSNAIAASPNGLYTVISPKGFVASELTDFCNRVPVAWRSKMIIAYYQEPEDNLTTPALQQSYRDTVHQISQIVRPYGIKCGLELQEWTLDPVNNNSWAGTANLNNFVVEADVDNISWSIYETNLQNRASAQVGRIKTFMAQYPSLTWDGGAMGISVPGSGAATTAQRQTRANLAQNMIQTCRDNGAKGVGWFDFPSYSSSVDYGVDQYLLPVLQGF